MAKTGCWVAGPSRLTDWGWKGHCQGRHTTSRSPVHRAPQLYSPPKEGGEFDKAGEPHKRIGDIGQEISQYLQQHSSGEPTLNRMKGSHREFIRLESIPARMGTTRDETPIIIKLAKPTVKAWRCEPI